MTSLLPLVACSSSDSSAATGDSGALDAGSDTSDGAIDPTTDPSYKADPQDLDPTTGDPSLDIAGSWIYLDNNQPWVRVQFYGAWPPPATLFSWSCSVLLGTVNAPAVTYTVQSLSGTQTEYVEGIDKAKLTFANEPKGFRLLIADAALPFDRYGFECSVKKANMGTLAQDTSGSFDVKTKQPRPFGP